MTQNCWTDEEIEIQDFISGMIPDDTSRVQNRTGQNSNKRSHPTTILKLLTAITDTKLRDEVMKEKTLELKKTIGMIK